MLLVSGVTQGFVSVFFEHVFEHDVPVRVGDGRGDKSRPTRPSLIFSVTHPEELDISPPI